MDKSIDILAQLYRPRVPLPKLDRRDALGWVIVAGYVAAVVVIARLVAGILA